jgi:hypothetical protein
MRYHDADNEKPRRCYEHPGAGNRRLVLMQAQNNAQNGDELEYAEQHGGNDLGVLEDDRAALGVLTETPGVWTSTRTIGHVCSFTHERTLEALRRLSRDGRVEVREYQGRGLIAPEATSYEWRVDEARYDELLAWARPDLAGDDEQVPHSTDEGYEERILDAQTAEAEPSDVHPSSEAEHVETTRDHNGEVFYALVSADGLTATAVSIERASELIGAGVLFIDHGPGRTKAAAEFETYANLEGSAVLR